MARAANNLIIDVNCTDAIDELSDQDAGQLFKQLLKYNITGNYEKQGQVIDVMFKMMKPFIDDNKEAYKRKCSINKVNGSQGGRPTNQEAKKPNGYSENRTVIDETERLLNKPSAAKKSKEEYSKEEKENNTNAQIDEDFDNFWNAYQRKVAKGDARKAWKALKPTEELAFQIIESVKQQALLEDWQKDNGKFIPYPATWLRAERWNDEILGEEYDPEPKQLLSEDEIAEVLWGHLSPAQLEKEKAKEMQRREAKEQARLLKAMNQ